MLYHESDLEIREHYTDTEGFTEHVFALMHLLGFAFYPRIRDLRDKKLFIKGKADQYPALQSLISTNRLNLKETKIHWREGLRLATSIKQGTVTASLMLKKLASYPKQNGLAKALREIGRIERTLFMLDGSAIRHFVGGYSSTAPVAGATLLGISKRGNKKIRTLLVFIQKREHQSGKLADWVRELLCQKSNFVVTCALATKLVRITLALTTRQQTYEA